MCEEATIVDATTRTPKAPAAKTSKPAPDDTISPNTTMAIPNTNKLAPTPIVHPKLGYFL